MKSIDLEPCKPSKSLIYLVFYKGHTAHLSFIPHIFVQ